MGSSHNRALYKCPITLLYFTLLLYIQSFKGHLAAYDLTIYISLVVFESCVLIFFICILGTRQWKPTSLCVQLTLNDCSCSLSF